MDLNLLRPVDSGTSGLSIERLISSLRKQPVVGKGESTGTQGKKWSVVFRAKQKGHGIHG
jgi:hypothetical protein